MLITVGKMIKRTMVMKLTRKIVVTEIKELVRRVHTSMSCCLVSLLVKNCLVDTPPLGMIIYIVWVSQKEVKPSCFYQKVIIHIQ